MTDAEAYLAKAAQCDRLSKMMTDVEEAARLVRLSAEFAALAELSEERGQGHSGEPEQ